MSSEFIFYDYIDADSTGINIINDWLNGAGNQAKAHFNRMIDYLEASPPAGFQNSYWCSPFTWPLGGKWKGFTEIRKKVKRIQYRLICKVEDRNVFIVTWGFHKGNWETDITPKTAKDRVAQMKDDPGKYRRFHDST
jgi:hypothetical protein